MQRNECEAEPPRSGRFRAPGSPAAERREGHRLSPAFPLSEAKGEHRIHRARQRSGEMIR
jgi:hypothetical protein